MSRHISEQPTSTEQPTSVGTLVRDIKFLMGQVEAFKDDGTWTASSLVHGLTTKRHLPANWDDHTKHGEDVRFIGPLSTFSTSDLDTDQTAATSSERTEIDQPQAPANLAGLSELTARQLLFELAQDNIETDQENLTRLLCTLDEKMSRFTSEDHLDEEISRLTAKVQTVKKDTKSALDRQQADVKRHLLELSTALKRSEESILHYGVTSHVDIETAKNVGRACFQSWQAATAEEQATRELIDAGLMTEARLCLHNCYSNKA